MRLCMHFELTNIYWREECFERKVYTEMKYSFYTRYNLSVSVTVFVANKYERQNALWFLLHEDTFH
jgi:hypothetical protein